jgi:hypothetical protein
MLKNIIKKGALVKIKRISFWETGEYEWDEPKDDIYDLGIALYPLHGHDFRTSRGYETWKIRFSDGTTGVYHSKEIRVVAEG